MRRALGALALLALAGCPTLRYRSTHNAPGIVHLEAPPPGENGDPDRYLEPEDPGEREVYVGTGVVLGPATGRERAGYDPVDFELAVQVRLAYSELETSHRARDVPFPRPGWAMTLGWVPVQAAYRTPAPGGGDRDLDHFLGPLYGEVQRQWYPFTGGLGVAYYPDGRVLGVQGTITASIYGLRLRYLDDGELEVLGAFTLELPAAFNWSR